MLFIAFSCSNEPIDQNIESLRTATQQELEDIKTLKSEKLFDNVAFKGKPESAMKVALLTPTAVNTNPTGRIMAEPENYYGELPIDNNGGYTDWDGDGLEDDLVLKQQDCYFPKSKGWIEVWIDGDIANKVIVSYAVRRSASIIGFVDVDGDGLKDVIMSYAKYYPYNNVGGYTSSVYHYGLNVSGQYPLSPGEILSSLELTSLPNGNGPLDKIKWDLSGYGLTNYAMHMWFGAAGLGYAQTQSYDDWGLPGSYFFRGELNEIRFANEDDGCEDITIEFQL